MKKSNILKKSWIIKKMKKFKMPHGEQDFINSDKPIKMGLKQSSGPENVDGLKDFIKKIDKRADDLFDNEINTYMENKNTKSKFDVLFESLLNGMSADEKLELGVEPDEVEDSVEIEEFDDEDKGEITVSLTKDQVKVLRDILDKIDDIDVEEDKDDEDTDDEDKDDEDWSEESFEDETIEDEDEVEDDSSFGEGIETEVVSPEKGKKYMAKGANKVNAKPAVKGGKANKGKIPAAQEDPEEVPESKGKHYQSKEANKVKSSLNAGNDLF